MNLDVFFVADKSVAFCFMANRHFYGEERLEKLRSEDILKKPKSADFPTTDNSLIDNPDLKEEIQKLIAQRYYDPLYLFLLKKGHGDEEAGDILQSFFQDSIMEPKFLRKFPHRRGSFRAFLSESLEYHRLRVLREKRKRLVFSQKIFDDIPEKVPHNPDEAYNYGCAIKLFDTVIDEVETGCRAAGQDVHWEIFQERELESKMKGGAPPSFANICRKYGIKSTSVASGMVETVRRRFRRTMRLHVRRDVTSDDEVEPEIRNMIQNLSKKPRNIIEDPADI